MLEKDDFAFASGEYAGPTDLIDKATWRSIVEEPLGFSTASQRDNRGNPLMVSVILSVARLNATRNPRRLVNLSIFLLQLEIYRA